MCIKPAMLSNPSHLVYIALSSVFSVTFAVINMFTIYIFCCKFRLSTLTLTVMVNICASDIFVCLFSNTFYVVNLSHPVYNWSTGAVGCKLFKFLTMLANVSQVYCLCILNADRLRRLIYSTGRQWKRRQGIVYVSVGWIAATIVCLPRLAIFGEIIVKKVSALDNSTVHDVYLCKPISSYGRINCIVTIATFLVAYVLPVCHILYTLSRSQFYMWQRRRRIHLATVSNIVTRMNNKLALTFNTTGALFLVIWTPFFILSLLDVTNLLNKNEHHLNFSLRCTLLILGSAKPVIYLIFLDKFRNSFSFRCKRSRQLETNSVVSTADTEKSTKVRTSTNVTAVPVDINESVV